MDTKECNKSKSVLLISYIAFVFVIVVFYVISRCGYLWSDDYAMGYGDNYSFVDVLKQTKWFYFHLGGRYLSVAAQYMFDGLLGNKIWYDIVNTVFFSFFIMICGKLVNTSRAGGHTLLFVLLFWLLCPVPRETLFWIAGSTTYLWAHSLTFLFLLVFIKCKNKDYSWLGKLGLFFLSFFSPTEFIAGVSICGAFVVYYLCHVKEFKGNAVPLVVGFVIGTLVLMLAPGNFARMHASEQNSFFLWTNLKELILHFPKEIIKYKALWLFLVVMLLGVKRDNELTKKWMRGNWVLLLSLAWSIVAFSVVFRPYQRALFFTETLSIILLLRFFTDDSIVAMIEPFSARLKVMFGEKAFASRYWLVGSLLFAIFLVDASFAIKETVRQKNNNNRLLSEIAAAGGVAAVDYPLSSHRMAYAPDYPKWSWPGIAYQLGLDSVHVYPYFCQDKYYRTSPLGDRVWLDKQGLADVNPNYHLSKNCMLFFRIPVEELQDNQQVVFKISYSRPHKWWKEWLDKYRNYVYERESVVRRDKPDEVFDGYNFYVVWFLKENAKNINAVEIEMHH